jgi:hypothetical protein
MRIFNKTESVHQLSIFHYVTIFYPKNKNGHKRNNIETMQIIMMKIIETIPKTDFCIIYTT